jgi:hypothetical protein
MLLMAANLWTLRLLTRTTPPPKITRVRGALGVLVLFLVVSLLGCSSYSGGTSSTCKYGRKSTSSGFYCNTRPQPSAAVLARAMSPHTIPRAIAVFEKTHPGAPLLSVGLNHWGETTFTYGPSHFHAKLVTYDIHDKVTSGNDGYISQGRDPITLGDVHPTVLAQMLAAARKSNPKTTLVSAELDHGPFSDGPEWRVGLITKSADADILYRASANGTGFCHGTDYNRKDHFVPIAGVPACPDNVRPL